MRTMRLYGLAGGAGCCLVLLWALSAFAQQSFSSGSTGALGAFNPTSNTTVTLPPDGVLNYTTINIPSGVTVTFARNAANTPVTMLATGDVLINGTINVDGTKGGDTTGSGILVNPGGAPGPGGFPGGQGGARGVTNNNNAGSDGQGPGGGTISPASANYGAPFFNSLLPLFGGSGGAGGSGGPSFAGASGGGGGGAIVIASTTKITANGTISANGGAEGSGCSPFGGGGSGGAIRLVAPQVTGSVALTATGGFSNCITGQGGKIRVEAAVIGLTNAANPAATTSATPGAITAASTPALINLPTLAITSIGGVASPTSPGGSYTTADVSLPSGTTNPVTVALAATNIPVGTVFTVRVIPQGTPSTSFNSAQSSGAFSSSTATTNVTFPNGQVSLLNAFSTFTLTASLFPLIDGEEVDRMLVGAVYGEPSSATVITKSGKEVRIDQLPPAVQLAFAKGWEAMQRER
jgi:hypothetical protein